MTTLPVHPGADAVLDALDPEQREVAAHPSGPMCVLAGAGTGKTRAITHRIAYGVLSGVYQPQRVLAVTFTARAAGEMRTRLRDLGVGGVQARTFHAASLRQLHYFWPQAIGGASPEVMPHKASAVAEAGGRGCGCGSTAPAVRDLASEIEWSKVSLLTPESYAAAATARRREPPAGLDATAMARLVAAYEEVKTERGVIDFEDVLLLMVGILREHDEVARAVRSQYRHFVVDEYQDVNRLQQTLLELWLGERRDLCVVGDPAQTIYSFTGASPEHLLGFRTRHPEARTVELVRNYRSTPQVVGPRQPRPAWPRRAAALRRRRAAGPAGRRPGARARRRRQRPRRGRGRRRPHRRPRRRRATRPPRSRSCSAPTARARGSRSALAERGIPYLVRGGERFFSRKEVRDALVLLRGCRPVRRRLGAAARPRPRRAPRRRLDPRGRRRAAARHVSAGSRWRRSPPSPTTCSPRDPQARLPALVRELDERAVGPARTDRPGRDAGLACTRPRAWSGTPSSSSAAPTGCCPSRWPTRRRRSRRSVGCSTSASPGRASASSCRMPGAHPGGEGDPPALALPRRHGGRPRRGGPVPAAQPKGGAGRAGRRRAPVRIDVPLVRRRPRHRQGAHHRALLLVPARRWTSGCSRRCASGASRRPERPTCPPSSSSPTPPSPPSPSGCRPTSASLARINGVGPAKLERYGEAVLDLLQEFFCTRE